MLNVTLALDKSEFNLLRCRLLAFRHSYKIKAGNDTTQISM